MNMKCKMMLLAALGFVAGHAVAGTPAARVGSPTSDGGSVVTGLPSVLIGNRPAARVGDPTISPRVVGVVPCIGGVILTGSSTVLIGGRPAARVGSLASTVCGPVTITRGANTVLTGP